MSDERTALGAHALPTRRDELVATAAGGDLLVYDPAMTKVQRLNSTAAAVWRLCDGTRFIDDVVGAVAATYEQEPEVIAVQVVDVVAGFARAGLLRGAEPVALDLPDRAVDDSFPGVEQSGPGAQGWSPDGEPLRTLGPYRALDRRIEVAVHDSEAIIDELERVLAPLATVPTSTPPQRFTVWEDDGWRLDAGGHWFRAVDASVIADFVMFRINWLAFEQSVTHFVLHGAVVAAGGAAVVLPATANSGKSTLATALVRAGFDYLSDEAAAIDLDSGRVYAHPKPITLDPGSQALFTDLDPGRLPGRSTKWYVAPDAIRPGCTVESAEVAHFVFPAHVPGADNELVRLDVADAAELLVSHSFNLAEHGHRLADIVALAEGATCHSLEHDGIDGPVTAISSLL